MFCKSKNEAEEAVRSVSRAPQQMDVANFCSAVKSSDIAESAIARTIAAKQWEIYNDKMEEKALQINNIYSCISKYLPRRWLCVHGGTHLENHSSLRKGQRECAGRR